MTSQFINGNLKSNCIRINTYHTCSFMSKNSCLIVVAVSDDSFDIFPRYSVLHRLID